MNTARHLILFCLILLLSGCATSLKKVDPDLALAPKGFIAPVSRAPVTAANRKKEADLEFLDVYDPWNSMNRYIYSFNAQFDRAIYLPL